MQSLIKQGGWIGPAIAAAASIYSANQASEGAADSNLSNALQAERNREFSHDEAQYNRDWQYEMSSTAYERAMGDMKRAGLNPMLAYSQGGAQTGSGATASAPSTAPMQNSKGAGVAAGIAALSSSAQVQQIQAAIDKTHAETENIQADTLNKREMPANTRASTAHLNKMVDNLSAILGKDIRGMSTRDWEREATRMLYEVRANERDITEEEKRFAHAYFKARASGLSNDAALSGLEIPKSINEAKSQESWWMKNISPYMPDFSRATGGAADLRRRSPVYNIIRK